MDPVSRKTEKGIESAYFDIKYRPSIDRSNFKLNINCDSLLTYMAFADITRKEEQINHLQEKFLETLSECKTDEELNNLKTFLEKAAEVGGYASTFYSNNISLISSQKKEYVQKKFKAIQNEKRKPVSSLIENGIKSEYFNVHYRPWDYSDIRSIKCSSLLTFMALADITRKEEQIKHLMLLFYEILSSCNTPEDFSKLTIFMSSIANVGGFAIEFNNKVKELINQEGKIKAQEYIKNEERHKKADNEKFEEFKESYARLNMLLDELIESNAKDDEEVLYLLKQYNELQSDVYDLNGAASKEFISQYDEQIEDSINYLKRLYYTLDEIKNSSMGF